MSLNIMENEQMSPFNDLVEQIMSLPDSSITEQTIDMMIGMVNGALTPSIREDAMSNIIKDFEERRLTRAEARFEIDEFKETFAQLVKELAPSENKKILLEKTYEIFFDIFERAFERYHKEGIVLPIQLEEGAKVPTYAHEDDAAADIYANETVVVKAHSLGNFIHTGVKIGLPEGWRATILPRSSTGAKTPLRLSNSQGLIDTSYRGEIMLLFDNISDSDYVVNKGDRLAQLEVKPVYRFKPQIVESLDTTDRGEGGFGSSGK